MDVSVLHITKCAVIGVDVTSIKENYFIVDSGGAAYGGELGHGFNPPISINITMWCVMEHPVQWYIEVDILGVLLYLVKNYGRHK